MEGAGFTLYDTILIAITFIELIIFYLAGMERKVNGKAIWKRHLIELAAKKGICTMPAWSGVCIVNGSSQTYSRKINYHGRG